MFMARLRPMLSHTPGSIPHLPSCLPPACRACRAFPPYLSPPPRALLSTFPVAVERVKTCRLETRSDKQAAASRLNTRNKHTQRCRRRGSSRSAPRRWDPCCAGCGGIMYYTMMVGGLLRRTVVGEGRSESERAATVMAFMCFDCVVELVLRLKQ